MEVCHPRICLVDVYQVKEVFVKVFDSLSLRYCKLFCKSLPAYLQGYFGVTMPAAHYMLMSISSQELRQDAKATPTASRTFLGSLSSPE